MADTQDAGPGTAPAEAASSSSAAAASSSSAPVAAPGSSTQIVGTGFFDPVNAQLEVALEQFEMFSLRRPRNLIAGCA